MYGEYIVSKGSKIFTKIAFRDQKVQKKVIKIAKNGGKWSFNGCAPKP